MKVLVLGGGGFMGSAISSELVLAGHDVRIFEKARVKRENVAHILGRVEWLEGDFTNEKNIKEALYGVEVVIHAISTTLPKTSNDNPAYDISTNVVPTLNLLDAARLNGVKRVIFFSSGGTVYGIPQKTPVSEDHPTDPVCSYGIQKLAIEKYLGLFNHLYGLDYVILRVANPYGPFQDPTAAQGAVMVFLYKVMAGEPIEIWGDGSVTRDYLYVSDVASAVMRAMDYAGGCRIFNIGSGKGLTLNELIRAIEKVAGKKAVVRFTPSRRFDVPVNILDITRAGKELLWAPAVDIEQGIAKTREHLKGRI